MRALAKAFGALCVVSAGCAAHPESARHAEPPRSTITTHGAEATTKEATKVPEVTVAPAEPQAPACAPVDEALLAPPPCDDAIARVPVPPIVDPSGSLAHFHEKLAARARGEPSQVRLALYGDSNSQADMMTGHMRRVLQGRLGDAGHGFVVLGHPKGWYGHQDVRRGASWKVFRNIQVSNDLVTDGNYGFANIASETMSPGARAWVATAKEGAVGTRASTFDVFYFRRPLGGSFDIVADGAVVKTVQTRADAFEAGIEHITLEDGPHEVALLSRGHGPVRWTGIALERDVPGVVVDALGTGAMNIGHMTWVKTATRRPMLEKRAYDLVILHLGTAQGVLSEHKEWAKKVIAELREALPEVSILFLTPPDLLIERTGPTSDPRIAVVSKQIEEIASEAGVAFWDYRSAMGGAGSMLNFMQKKLAWTDAVHLANKGHQLMGDRLMRALLEDNARYRHEHAEAGCSSRPAQSSSSHANESEPM